MNSICIACLSTVCKCGQHQFVSYSYKGRIPKANASKKKWVTFIDMFLSYDPGYKAIAMNTLNKDKK